MRTRLPSRLRKAAKEIKATREAPLADNLRRHKPKMERIITADRYGNHYYKTYRDSVLQVKGMREAVKQVKSEVPNPILIKSKGLWEQEDLDNVDKLTAKDKKRNSAIRKLPGWSNSDMEPMIKVGVTPARKLVMEDKETGGKVFVRIPEKEKFVKVGVSTRELKHRGKGLE